MIFGLIVTVVALGVTALAALAGRLIDKMADADTADPSASNKFEARHR